MDWTQIYTALFLVSLALSLTLTPLFRKIAAMTDFMDIPKCEQHKSHRRPIPLLGGAAMGSAWLLTVLLGILAGKFFLPEHVLSRVTEELTGMNFVMKDFFTIALCALGALTLGLFDDKRAMKPGKKFIGQAIIAAVTATWGGVNITLFVGFPLLSWLLTFFWIVFIFNAINFFDNMDGLAVGTSAIAFLFFTAAALYNKQYFVASLGASLAGTSIGFWFYNHSPASIFMGDGGSHFLGYMLAVLSAKVTYYDPLLSASKFNILIPVFILAVPIFDTLAVMLIRIRNHKPVYIGDNNHISHRFNHMGMSRKHAVVIVHLLGIISGLGAMPLLWGDGKSCILLLVQGVVILLLLSLIQYYSPVIHESNPNQEKKP